MQKVTPKDEWCVEAYMETDYNKLTEQDFIKNIKAYVAFQFISEKYKSAVNESFNNEKFLLEHKSWKYFLLGDIFEIKRGKEIINNCAVGKIPVISSKCFNNGVNIYGEGYHLFKGNSITVANNGSVGSAFYQEVPFYATSDINVLSTDSLNNYNALFIITLIENEKYRFNYGRKWGLERMKKFKIKFPVDNNGNIDWDFMEDYIKSLPYSKNIK